MPIGLEEWRARIGLFNLSRAPRSLAASRGRKYRRIKQGSLLLSLISTVLLHLFSELVEADHSKNVGRRVWDGIAAKSLFSPCSPITKGFSLLQTCLIVVQMLLIMAGDVEQNPGPLTTQGQYSEFTD